MKIKHWISGSGNGQDGGNGNASAAAAATAAGTKKQQQTIATVIKSSSSTVVITEKLSGGAKEHPDLVAKLRPTSLNVNQLNYNVVDLKKFIR